MIRTIARSTAVLTLCSTAFVGLGAGAASAGEITGNKKSLKTEQGGLHGKSECAYSGLNDEFVLGDSSAPRVQTPAEAVQFGMPGIAGYFCNPTGTRGFPGM